MLAKNLSIGSLEMLLAHCKVIQIKYILCQDITVDSTYQSKECQVIELSYEMAFSSQCSWSKIG